MFQAAGCATSQRAAGESLSMGERIASMNQVKPLRWLVGGPSRNGKTSLVSAIGASGALAALPVEALFTVVLDARPADVRSTLSDYLQRPRWTDPARSVSATPAQSFHAPVRDIVEKAASEAHPLAAIARALDLLAEEQNRAGWIACDLLPETRWAELRSLIPGLRLAIVLRDPRAACCASLYWRTFPARVVHWKQALELSAFQWCLAAQTAFGLAQRYPDEVAIVLADQLMRRDTLALQRCAELFGADVGKLQNALPAALWFSYQDGNFLTPNGTSEPLLSPAEIALVEAIARPWMPKLGITPSAPPVSAPALTGRLLAVGRSSPELARRLGLWRFLPLDSLRRVTSRLARRIRKPRLGASSN